MGRPAGLAAGTLLSAPIADPSSILPPEGRTAAGLR